MQVPAPCHFPGERIARSIPGIYSVRVEIDQSYPDNLSTQRLGILSPAPAALGANFVFTSLTRLLQLIVPTKIGLDDCDGNSVPTHKIQAPAVNVYSPLPLRSAFRHCQPLRFTPSYVSHPFV